MLPRLRSRRALVVLGALIALAAVGAYVAYRIVLDDPGDISNPDVEFVDPTATPTPEPGKRGKRRKPFEWPRYGFTKDHNRSYDPGYRLEGPFKEIWKRGTPALAEFPPVMEDGRLYQIVDNGLLRAYDAERGKILWKRDLGRLSASSPAIEDGRIYVTRRCNLFGAQDFGLRSRFLDEIPRELTDQPDRNAVGAGRPAGRGRVASWATAAAASLASQEDTSSAVFRPGDDVVHAAFGDGVVTGVRPGGVVVVRFSNDGTERNLMADYAPLRKR